MTIIIYNLLLLIVFNDIIIIMTVTNEESIPMTVWNEAIILTILYS